MRNVYLLLLMFIPFLLLYGVYYLVLLLALPILVFYSPRLGFAIIAITVILIYRSRVRSARRKSRRRAHADEQPRRMTPWKDPWGTAKPE